MALLASSTAGQSSALCCSMELCVMLWCCVVVWTLGIRAAEAMSECVRGVSVITGTMGSAVVERGVLNVE